AASAGPVAPSPRRVPIHSNYWAIQWLKATKGRHMAAELEVGDKPPAFTLDRDGGEQVSLKDFKGKKLVIFFYPKANTPGCTRESIAFSRLKANFAKAGAAVIGVSADPVAAHDKFKAKHDLTVPLGSDPTHKMLKAYGA